MKTSNKPVIAALVIAVLFFLIGPPIVVHNLSVKEDDEDRQDSIAGCERNNQRGVASFSNSILDAATREAAAPGFEGKQKADVLRFAQLNWEQAQIAVDTILEDGVARENWVDSPEEKVINDLAQANLERPGSPEVDCEAAFR